MAEDKVIDKKPGEKPAGKLHFNPGNMSGKSAETPKGGEGDRTVRESDLPKR